MAIFNYVAKDFQGNYHKGEIETSDTYQAALILRRKKMIVVSLKTKVDTDQKLFGNFFNKVPFSNVVVVTRQLATMIEAGLVLSEALDILEEEQSNPRFKKILKDISSDLKSGLDFASSLEKYPDVFPTIYSKLVRAGQTSGKLDVVLLELATNLEKERDFQNRIRGAMIYPIVVVTMMLGVMLIMVFFVMPKLLNLYNGSGIDLPLPTKIVIGFTNFLLGFWWAVLLVIIIGILSFRRYSHTKNGKTVIDTLLIKAPVVGRIITLITLTNFTRTFALLVSSGISILEAIKIVSTVVGNDVFQTSLELSYKGVERGLPLSSQILGIPAFPKIVGQMIKTGEETGKLDDVMFRLADYFQSESDNSLKNITTLIEPLILIVLGVGVGFLVVSIILPIYQLTTNIQ